MFIDSMAIIAPRGGGGVGEVGELSEQLIASVATTAAAIVRKRIGIMIVQLSDERAARVPHVPRPLSPREKHEAHRVDDAVLLQRRPGATRNRCETSAWHR